MNTRQVVKGLLLVVLVVPWAALSGGCKREESTPTSTTAPAARAAAPSGRAPTAAEAPPAGQAPAARPAAPGGAPPGPGVSEGELVLPEMDFSKLPLALQTRIGDARYQARRAPGDALKVGDLGALCYVHGFPETAVVCFRRAAQVAPEEPGWWYYLGLASERTKDLAQAKAAYEKCLAIKDYEPARLRLTALSGAPGKPGGLPEQPIAPVPDPLRDFLLLEGAQLEAMLVGAIAMGQVQQFERAEKLLKDAREIDESGVRTRTAQGQLLAMQGKFDEAARELEGLLSTPEGKDFTPAKIHLARVSVARKDYEKAERLMREVLQKIPPESPSFPEAANSLAWILVTSPNAKQRKPEEAIQWAEKACERTKYADHALLDTLAAAYAAAGRFDDARKWVAEAIKLAQDAQRTQEVQDYQRRQALYAAGKPYHESE